MTFRIIIESLELSLARCLLMRTFHMRDTLSHTEKICLQDSVSFFYNVGTLRPPQEKSFWKKKGNRYMQWEEWYSKPLSIAHQPFRRKDFWLRWMWPYSFIHRTPHEEWDFEHLPVHIRDAVRRGVFEPLPRCIGLKLEDFALTTPIFIWKRVFGCKECDYSLCPHFTPSRVRCNEESGH